MEEIQTDMYSVTVFDDYDWYDEDDEVFYPEKNETDEGKECCVRDEDPRQLSLFN